MRRVESKHTPGPWTLSKFGGINGGPFLQYANGMAQSQIACATVGNGITEEERDANARLMATSPKMAEVLVECGKFFTDAYDRDELSEEDIDLWASISRTLDAAGVLTKAPSRV